MRLKIFYSQCLTFIIAIIVSISANAQLQITTPDTIICPTTSANLQATIGTGVLTPITFPQLDDSYSPIQNLGFSFNFFGTNYTSCVISQNGFISFNTSNAGLFSPWNITQAIPGNPNCLNSALGFYADIYPGLSTSPGIIESATLGTAPYRKYIVNFCDCPMFSCTTLKASFQIILYETTNEVEVHIGNAPNCPTWNGGAAIEGVHDATGTIAFWVAGRNYPTNWTASQSSHKFTPVNSTTYNITAIPYAPIPSPGSTITWYANGTTLVGTGTSLSVSPTTTTFYVAETVKCSDTLRDTVTVTVGGGPAITNVDPQPNNPNIPISKKDPTTCGGTNGYITLYGLDPNQLYSVHYKKNGVLQPPLALTSTVFGYLTLGGLPASVYDSIYVLKGVCFSNAVGPIILTDPPVIAAYTFTLHKGCKQDTVVFKNNSIQNTFNKWIFGDGTGDTAKNPTHIYLIQGVYNVKLIVTNGICKDSVTHQVNTLHPLKASFKADDDSVCAGQIITFTNTSSGTNATYKWSFGDNTTSTLTNPTHTYPIPGSYNVVMVVKDDIPCYDTFRMPILVDTIPYAKFVTSDSVLCEGDRIAFLANFLETGNTNFVWSFGDGNSILNTNNIAHAFDTSGSFNVTFTASYRNCPDIIVTKNMVIKPYPVLNLGPDTTICPNASPLVIGDYINSSTLGASWIWNTGETTPTINVLHQGIYTTKVNLNGCETSDSIEVFKDCYLDIPNSFTPNGDGFDDYFIPRQLLSRGILSFKMNVFNRWGEVVFETNKVDGRGWDGKFNDKEQPTGVYIYMIDVVFKDNYSEKYQGNITLLR